MAVSRPTCGRCGTVLTFTDSDGVVLSTEDLTRQNRQERWGRVAGLTFLTVLAAVIAISGALRLRTGRQTPIVSLSAALQAPSEEADDLTGVPTAADTVTDPAGTSAAGIRAFDAGDLRRALELSLAALDERPGDPAALNNVGQVLVALDRPADAIAYLERAVDAQPSESAFRFNLAVALTRSGNVGRGLDLLRELGAAAPGDARVQHNLGLALRRAGTHEEALAAFRRATDAAPAEPPAWLGLGLSFDSLGRGPEAADAFDRYLALAPDDGQAESIRRRVQQLRTEGARSAAGGAGPAAGEQNRDRADDPVRR